MLRRIIKYIKCFGFAYTFIFILQKAGIKIEMPVKLILRKQHYYESLPLEKQKEELCEFYRNSTGKNLILKIHRHFPKNFSGLNSMILQKKKHCYLINMKLQELLQTNMPAE